LKNTGLCYLTPFLLFINVIACKNMADSSQISGGHLTPNPEQEKSVELLGKALPQGFQKCRPVRFSDQEGLKGNKIVLECGKNEEEVEKVVDGSTQYIAELSFSSEDLTNPRSVVRNFKINHYPLSEILKESRTYGFALEINKGFIDLTAGKIEDDGIKGLGKVGNASLSTLYIVVDRKDEADALNKLNHTIRNYGSGIFGASRCVPTKNQDELFNNKLNVMCGISKKSIEITLDGNEDFGLKFSILSINNSTPRVELDEYLFSGYPVSELLEFKIDRLELIMDAPLLEEIKAKGSREVRALPKIDDATVIDIYYK
jgi:hypothetical protein